MSEWTCKLVFSQELSSFLQWKQTGFRNHTEKLEKWQTSITSWYIILVITYRGWGRIDGLTHKIMFAVLQGLLPPQEKDQNFPRLGEPSSLQAQALLCSFSMAFLKIILFYLRTFAHGNPSAWKCFLTTSYWLMPASVSYFRPDTISLGKPFLIYILSCVTLLNTPKTPFTFPLEHPLEFIEFLEWPYLSLI